MDHEKLVLQALIASGITSPKAQANILAQVQAESNFKPQSESYRYSADTLYKLWGPEQKKNRKLFGSYEEAERAAAMPQEQLASMLQDGNKGLGNKQQGDGWRYRGRGFLQITGRAAYEALGKKLGVDLLADPDLLNEPAIAAQAVPWFFQEFKGASPGSLEDPRQVFRMVGPATSDLGKRNNLARQYEQRLAGGALGPAPDLMREAVASASSRVQNPPLFRQTEGLAAEGQGPFFRLAGLLRHLLRLLKR